MAQSNPMAAVQGLFKTPELKEKILFTLLCLLIYRIGAHVTAPGVNPVGLTDFFKQQSGGLLGLYDLFTGGQLSRAPVFAAWGSASTRSTQRSTTRSVASRARGRAPSPRSTPAARLGSRSSCRRR